MNADPQNQRSSSSSEHGDEIRRQVIGLAAAVTAAAAYVSARLWASRIGRRTLLVGAMTGWLGLTAASATAVLAGPVEWVRVAGLAAGFVAAALAVEGVTWWLDWQDGHQHPLPSMRAQLLLFGLFEALAWCVFAGIAVLIPAGFWRDLVLALFAVGTAYDVYQLVRRLRAVAAWHAFWRARNGVRLAAVHNSSTDPKRED